MRRLLLLPTLLALLPSLTAAADRPWLRASDFDSLEIVIAEDANEFTRLAAQELAEHWNQLTKRDLPIVHAPTRKMTHIFIGDSPAAAPYIAADRHTPLSGDGIRLKTLDRRTLLLYGPGPRSPLFATYEFIEQALGIRWLTPDTTHFPQDPPKTLPRLDIAYTPVFEFRWSTYLSSDPKIAPFRNRHRWVEGPGFSCHTFFDLVPPEQYFKDHPEYFSEINGKRIAPADFNYNDHATWGPRRNELTQLCMTNPDVIRIITDKAVERMRANPNLPMIHVSQEDWYGYCTCPTCRAIDEREGTNAAAILTGLNQIADGIARALPGHGIETLAYQFTRKPPKTLAVRDNIAIKLCSIECDFSEPLDAPGNPLNAPFFEDLRNWSKQAPRLHIWNYSANFSNFQSPYPNLHVLQRNQQIFAENNVKGIFEQGCYDHGGSLAYLETYLISKLMWNPYCDADAVINEFLDLYYREAAPFLREYIKLITDKVTAPGVMMHCFDPGNWMDYDTVLQAEEIFQRAFAAAKSPEIRERLRLAHIPVQYSALKCPPVLQITDDEFALRRPPSPTLDEYVAILKAHNITHVCDFFPFERFLDQIGRATPPREIVSPLVKLNDTRIESWVTPAIAGSTMRLRDAHANFEFLQGYQLFGYEPGTMQLWYWTADGNGWPVNQQWQLAARDKDAMTMQADATDHLRITQTYTLGQNPGTLHIRTRIANTGNTPEKIWLRLRPELNHAQGAFHLYFHRNGGWEKIALPEIPFGQSKVQFIEGNPPDGWAVFYPQANTGLECTTPPGQVFRGRWRIENKPRRAFVMPELIFNELTIPPAGSEGPAYTFRLLNAPPPCP